MKILEFLHAGKQKAVRLEEQIDEDFTKFFIKRKKEKTSSGMSDVVGYIILRKNGVDFSLGCQLQNY